MGYGVYWNGSDQRWCGYEVPAYCDQPFCMKKIDRGMGYVCGEPLQDEFGCGRYFCEDHLRHSRFKKDAGRHFEQCAACYNYKPMHKKISPERPMWMRHVLKDKSWKEWRDENPAIVKKYAQALADLKAAKEKR